MEKFSVDMVALFAAALGETRENTRLTERMPVVATGVANHVARGIVEYIEKAAATESEGRLNLRINYSDLNLRERLDEYLLEDLRAANKRSLQSSQVIAVDFRLPARWTAKLKRIVDSIEHADAKTMQIQVEELIVDFVEELKEPRFLYISPNRRQYFDQDLPQFGEIVADKFPDAKRDIAAAARCFALDEWTACVFHLMRVLEHGLRPMAQRFNVPFTIDSWHKVIKGIEDGINALRNKHGLTDQDRLEISFYSEAAAQFRYLKDAWRNHVAHAREHYDERDAETVMTHVRELMRHLTGGP